MSLDLLQNASTLASSHQKKKESATCRFQASNRFAVPVDEQSREKASESHRCRHRLMQLPNSRSSLSPSLIQSPIPSVLLKIPYPRSQKARGDDLLSRILPEFHFQKAELPHKTLHNSSSTAQKFRKHYKPVKIPHTLVHYVIYCTRAWSRGLI